MKERLDNQEEILRSHEERVRHAMDKRDLWVQIEDIKQNQEHRIKQYMALLGQELRDHIDTKADLEQFKEHVAGFVRQSEFSKS